jgi:quinoprotein glucose dehydrogenase
MSRILFVSLALTVSLQADDQGLVASPALPGASIPKDTTLTIEADFKPLNRASPAAITFDEQGRIFMADAHRSGVGLMDDREHPYWLSDAASDSPASAILAHEGIIYLGGIPRLLMLRDTDGDGRADESLTIQKGFGVRLSPAGHDMGGFTLGPDGRIYGTIGDCGMDFTTKEGVLCHLPHQGAVFRFELDGSGFELFHTGLRNPKGIAFDALGYPFTVDGNSGQGDSARVIYLVQGGDSGWETAHQTMVSSDHEAGMGKHLPNRWMDEKMWQLANPAQPAFMLPPVAHLDCNPASITCHPGTGLLEEQAGRFLICDHRNNPADSGVWSFAIISDGVGMKMTDSRKILSGVAATAAAYSWDGRLFITDAGDASIPKDGHLLSLSAGPRTWRAPDAASAAKIMREGFGQRSSAELAHLLKHPDARIRLRAQLALTRKSDAHERFAEASLSTDLLARVHGVWGLGILVRRGALPVPFSEFSAVPAEKMRAAALDKLLVLSLDKNEEIRCQALRVLADAGSDPAALEIGRLLGDPSTRVRFFATLLIGRRKMLGYYGPVCEMLAENDNKDLLLRHAGAYALQQMAADPATISALCQHDSAAVRLAAVIALRRMKTPEVAAFIPDTDPKVTGEAVRAVCDLDLTEARPAAAALLDAPEKHVLSPFMMRQLLHNSFHIGDEENAARVLRIAADANQPTALREEGFRLIREWCQPLPVDQLTGNANPPAPRDTALLVQLLEKKLPPLFTQDTLSRTAAIDLNDHYQIHLAIPAAPPPAAVEIAHESSGRNPWLYIIIGFLLVTGALLYIDPRIF